jgi:hypothetical protein
MSYPYQLDAIRPQLEGYDWLPVLRPFRHVRVATLPQLISASGLSRDVVERVVRHLLTIKDDQGRQILKTGPSLSFMAGSAGRGAAVYRLDWLGAALLHEQGLIKEIRPSGQEEASALIHSLCILEMALAAERAGFSMATEQVLKRGAHTIRPDGLLTVPGQPAQLYEIEQAANATVAARIVGRLVNWAEYFAQTDATIVSPRVTVLFNVPQRDMSTTLRVWQTALDQVGADYTPLKFEIHYAPLAEFLKNPSWGNLSHLTRMTPDARAATPEDGGDTAARVEDRLLKDMLAGEIDFKVKDFVAFAKIIYSLSYPDVKEYSSEYDVFDQIAFPVESLNALRNYLNLPQNDDLRNGLSRALPLIKSQAGMTVTLNLMTRIIWDVWLRHVGMGRNEHLQVCVRPPNSDVDNSEYRVSVKVSTQLAKALDPFDEIYPGEPATEPYEKALAWVLEAPFFYAYELGLSDEPLFPSSRRKKGKRK